MEICNEHSKLVEKVGILTGKIETVISGNNAIQESIDKLHTKVNSNVLDAAVQKTKLAPVFWVILIISGIVLTSVVTTAWNKIMSPSQPQQQTIINK